MLWLPADEEATSGLMLQLEQCVDQGAVEQPLYEGGSTKLWQVCFHQQAAVTLMSSGPGLQKSFGIGIELNVNTVGIQECRQAVTDCLVRIYHVN